MSNQTTLDNPWMTDNERCEECGCLEDDHFVPDTYDPSTWILLADGHLNTCGDCAECFREEE
jgi:hypothetical protein